MVLRSEIDQDYLLIQELIAGLGGRSDEFVARLQRDEISHISFSQVTTVEFCEYRYYLQYIRMLEPDPTPDYFTKGKLFHQIVASYYQGNDGEVENPCDKAFSVIAENYRGENQRHLENAFLVHLENSWSECEVIAVEHPFVLNISTSLPPCVGVIDLIVKKNDTYIIVDHKTGRDFYPQDELQMAIYVEYVRRFFGQVDCAFYYDHYRWINNLNRIRKPAFQRDSIEVNSDAWRQALARISSANETINRIRTTRRAFKNGECFRCPYRKTCYPD